MSLCTQIISGRLSKEPLPGLSLERDGTETHSVMEPFGHIANIGSWARVLDLQWQPESWYLKSSITEKLARELSFGLQCPAKRRTRCLLTVYQLYRLF